MAAHENLGSQFKTGLVSTPTPDGGTSSQTAGPIIQANWEALRDSGVSAQDATYQLHNLVPPPAPAEGTNPSWLNSQQMPLAPNNATMSGPLIPQSVRAPEVTPSWSPPPSLGSNIVQNLTNFSQLPTAPTDSYGPAGDFLNKFVVKPA